LNPNTLKNYEQFINEIKLEEDDCSDYFSGYISTVYTTGSFRDIDAERAIQELKY
jgi:hypothetical protein